MSGSFARSLESIVPNANGDAKGFVSYRPASKTRPLVERILGLVEEFQAADALPIGPGQVGYRLKERWGYTKADFPEIGRVLKRLAQAGEIPFDWVADGASRTLDPGGFSALADFLEVMPYMRRLDRRLGQPLVLEVYTEARETLPLIQRLGAERGVLVYSGSGSCGPKAAHEVTSRALARAVELGQSTRIFAICDFDEHGVKNILRPHVEHVAAFLYGVDPRSKSVLAQDDLMMEETGATVEVVHLALTPEMACELEPDHADAIGAYIASGVDLFERDLRLIVGLPKIELEAVDPVALRALVAGALDALLDADQLDAVAEREAEDREALRRVAVSW